MKLNNAKKYFKIFLIILFVCSTAGCAFNKDDPSVKYDGIVDVNDANFDKEVLHSELPVFVFFYGGKCEPSWEKMPRVLKIADKAKGKLKVCKIEATTVYVLQAEKIPNPIISKKYKLGGLPTAIIFNNGKEIVRDINGVSPGLYRVDINPLLEKLTGLKY